MNVHPQLFRTIHLLEALRRAHKPKTLSIRFGAVGLESVIIDGEALDPGEVEFLRGTKKLLDSGDAQKLG